MNKTFKGLLADQEELKIRLSTNDGLSGYQITKFTIFPKNFNVGDEHNFKIFTVSGKTLSTVFDFNDPQLLAAAYIENAGWGGRAAASISSLAIEYYLNKEIKRKWLESYVLKGEFIDYETK